MERNVSIRVPRPIHLDYTTNAILRDNVFITDGDMVLSFQQSSDCNFEKNIIVAPGKITIGWPNAVTTWKENVVYRNGQVMNGVPQAFTIDSAMPPYSIPDRRASSMKAVRVCKAPVLDGNIDYTEWPGDVFQLNRESSRLPSSGWSPRVELSYDNKNLYLGVFLTMRDPGLIKRGSVWGQNDGLEVSIAGKTTEGTSATFVVRVYADGTIQSITDAGAPAASALLLSREIRIIAKDQKPTRGGGWSCELAIPFKAIGIKPVPGMNIPFNMCSYANEYDNWHMWEGTMGESWQVEKGGVLTLQ